MDSLYYNDQKISKKQIFDLTYTLKIVDLSVQNFGRKNAEVQTLMDDTDLAHNLGQLSRECRQMGALLWLDLDQRDSGECVGHSYVAGRSERRHLWTRCSAVLGVGLV